jgi:hypothetical protein
MISLKCICGYSNPVSKDTTLINKGIYTGLTFSTMGYGVTVTKKISGRLDIRLNGSYLGYTYDVNKLSKELQGDVHLKVGSIGGNIDFYVFRFLYLSGGIYYNLTAITIQAQKAESINIGDILLEPGEIGSLQAEITPGSKLDPYFGAGFNVRRDKKLNFGIEFGLFLQGAPHVKLRATGMLEPTASPEQEKIMENNISPLIYYPNISLRISYRIK